MADEPTVLGGEATPGVADLTGAGGVPSAGDAAAEAAAKAAAEAAAQGNEPGAKDATGDKDKVGAPEKYEDFTLPENFEVDKAMMEGFLPVAKELNLTQEQAQKLVDLQTARETASTESQTQQWEDLKTEWVTAAKADTEFGGVNFDANIGVARAALEKFGNQELRDALEVTGAGNHPEILRFFWKVGKAISEDTIKAGQPTPTPAKTAADIMFPNQGK